MLGRSAAFWVGYFAVVATTSYLSLFTGSDRPAGGVTLELSAAVAITLAMTATVMTIGYLIGMWVAKFVPSIAYSVVVGAFTALILILASRILVSAQLPPPVINVVVPAIGLVVAAAVPLIASFNRLRGA